MNPRVRAFLDSSTGRLVSKKRPEVELKQTLVNVIDYITACGIQRRPALDSMVKHRTSGQFSMLELASLSSPGTMGLDDRLLRLHPGPLYRDYRNERIGALLWASPDRLRLRVRTILKLLNPLLNRILGGERLHLKNHSCEACRCRFSNSTSADTTLSNRRTRRMKSPQWWAPLGVALVQLLAMQHRLARGRYPRVQPTLMHVECTILQFGHLERSDCWQAEYPDTSAVSDSHRY